MQVNNAKKNILYRRNEKRESIIYLNDTLSLIGENEATFGVSLVHIFQDLSLVHYELGEWELAIGYSQQLIENAYKTANKTHNALELLGMADNIINYSKIEIHNASLNPVSRFKIMHPIVFYSATLSILAGASFLGFKLLKP